MTKIRGLHIENKKGYMWITLPDSINMENYLQVRNRIESELIDNKKGKVAINFSNIDSIHSLLIGLILHSRKIVKQNLGTLCLVNTSTNCLIKLQALFLDKIMQIYESEEEIEKD